MLSEWNFAPEVIAKAKEIGIGARVAIHWSEAECQDQEGTIVGVGIHRHGKVEYAVHIDGDISPTDGFILDRTGREGGTIRVLSINPMTAPDKAGLLVGRLRPNAMVDHVPGLAVSELRAAGKGDLAERLNAWIVRNNELKSEAVAALEPKP